MRIWVESTDLGQPSGSKISFDILISVDIGRSLESIQVSFRAKSSGRQKKATQRCGADFVVPIDSILFSSRRDKVIEQISSTFFVY